MNKQGEFLSPKLMDEIRAQFCYVREDPEIGKRIFFENAGGSLRLRSVAELKENIEALPNCPDRFNHTSLILKGMQKKGIDDIMHVVFGAKSGALISELTASQTMFQLARAAAENTAGTNFVTTVLEHPSAYDSVRFYAEKFGRELREMPVDPVTKRIEAADVSKYVDKNTGIFSMMLASNITGVVMDAEAIFAEVRRINPSVFILSDAVQHAPHGAIDVEKLGVDGLDIAPYKMFGCRGCGFAYVSDRLATVSHHKVYGKEDNIWALGSPCPSNFGAMSAVVDYVCWLGSQFVEGTDRRALYVEGMERIHQHEQALLERMLNGSQNVPGLYNIKGVRVCGLTPLAEARDLIIAIAFDNLDPKSATEEYEKRNVIVFQRMNSNPFSKRPVEAIGETGVIRVSPLHCHGPEDVDEYLKITQEIAKL